MYRRSMTTTRTAPEITAKGTCLVCGQLAPLVNFRRYELAPGYQAGYLGRHGRPGINPRFMCRGSFEAWAERGTESGVAK